MYVLQKSAKESVFKFNLKCHIMQTYKKTNKPILLSCIKTKSVLCDRYSKKIIVLIAF